MAIFDKNRKGMRIIITITKAFVIAISLKCFRDCIEMGD